MLLGKKNKVSAETDQTESPVSSAMNPTPVTKTSVTNMNDVNRIAFGAKFCGDIATENDIRIDGVFEGRLYCAGRLVVGEKAVLKGDIFCANVDFSGKMTSGNIYARETLSLKAGCSAEVNLFYQRFQVELDARFAGTCKVLAEGEFEKLSAPVAALLKK